MGVGGGERRASIHWTAIGRWCFGPERRRKGGAAADHVVEEVGDDEVGAGRGGIELGRFE